MNLLTEHILNEVYSYYSGLLNESITIEKAKSVFNTIPENILQQLMEIDPTYHGGDKVGKFFTWIANSYLKDHSILGNPSRSKEILTIFKDNQTRFTQRVELKNFHNITEIESFLNDQGMLNQQEDDPIRRNIDNAEVRNGTNVQLNGNTWLIIIPTNYAAAKHFGSNTNWCTAADNDGSYYKHYLADYGGCYYILINKQDPSEKYQFHFESDQFMDVDDYQIGSKIYGLNGFSELDAFFKNAIGAHWAEIITHAGEEENGDNWIQTDTFSFDPNYYILRNEGTGEYKIVNQYGDDALDETFDALESINEDTGCALFKQNEKFGLIYISRYRGESSHIVKYAEGFDVICDADVLANDDYDWFYIGLKDDKYYLITNYQITMEQPYKKLFGIGEGKYGYTRAIAAKTMNNQIGLMFDGFEIDTELPGKRIISTNDYNQIIVDQGIQDTAYIYDVSTGEMIDLPLYGQITRIGRWIFGFVNRKLNAYDFSSKSLLFGKPLDRGPRLMVDRSTYPTEPILIYYLVNDGSSKIIYDTSENPCQFKLINDNQYVRTLTTEEAYNLISNA